MRISIDRCALSAFAMAVVLVTCLTAARAVMATPVRIPLQINYALLTEALRQKLYAHGGRAELWNGKNDCEYLYAVNPAFGQQEAIAQIETQGHLNLGVPVDGRCLSPITWSGIIEADTEPYIAGFALKLRVTDVNLYDANHQKSLLVGRGFDLIKANLVPALETYTYDLGPAIRELGGLAQMAAAPADEAALHNALATLRLEPAVVPRQSGLQLILTLDLPPPAVATGASAAPLTPAEVAAWNSTLDNWDAFLVFVIKQVGASVNDPNVRFQLLNILLDSRQRLVAALAQPQRLTGPDPVRLLFLEEWTRLGRVVEEAAAAGRLGDRALEFLSFISAGDALFALDQAASTLGLRISAGDLRRLARIMAPQATGDPLAYNFAEDPELRRLFGLGAPLELPGELEAPEPSAPATAPDDSGGPPPEDGRAAGSSPSRGSAGARPANPGGQSSPAPRSEPRSMLSEGWRAIAPRTAEAAENPGDARAITVQIVGLGRELSRVVVNQGNASSYRHAIGQLLELTAGYQLQSDPADNSVHHSWPLLVKATAWQESCWRQFVMKQGRVWYLESSSGDIGLMQINKYVWRGFYNLTRVRWDILYNVSAGAQILRRLLDESSRHFHSNDPRVLARATYAAYNGGPAAYDRWRRPGEARVLRAIDEAFWTKYSAIAAGRSFDILTCAAEWSRLH